MAVICGTECLFGTSCIRYFKMLQGRNCVVAIFISLFFLMCGSASGASAATVKDSCEPARNEITAAGFPPTAVLDKPNPNGLCGSESCCSASLEAQMSQSTKSHLDHFLRDSIAKLASILDTRSKKFDSLFREMMENSKQGFHSMFERTYGKIYLQNMYVFRDFFNELETYYKKGTTRLSDTLEKFFGILYQKMFKVINAKYILDDRYLDCVAEQMIAMKPFGDVPSKLSVQLSRSFVATRTYYKALSAAADVAREMLTLRVDQCVIEVTRMQQCGRCHGARQDGACNTFCETVMLQCLAQHVAFSTEWDSFIEALDKVADRLIGPYNIEMVVEPLKIKISEAVMNFQDSGLEITQKVFKICGSPPLESEARSKRQVEDDPSYEIDKPRKQKPAKRKKPKKDEVDESGGSSLEKLLREIKSRVKETRQFWKQLPYQYCNNATIVASPESDKCWNGTSTPRIPKPGTFPKSFLLQDHRERLKKAYEGAEVELPDDSDDFEGSGSGSGDFEITENETEEEKITKETEVDINNEIEVVKSEDEPDLRKEYSGGAATMPLCKALYHYLIPIVLVWFGGAISDLL